MSCNMYIPYTISELQDMIKEILDNINEKASEYEVEEVENGNDRYKKEIKDTIDNLYKQLSMWQRMLYLKQEELNPTTQPSNFTSKLTGCL